MAKRDLRTPEQKEEDERIERAHAADARLDETMTRREVVDAIELVINQYSTHHHSMTRELLQRLVKALS